MSGLMDAKKRLLTAPADSYSVCLVVADNAHSDSHRPLLCACAADVLVRHLQTLVDLGFKLTTGSAEALRPSGAQLLQQLLRFFGDVPDPDVPELLLLEQYQVCVCQQAVAVPVQGEARNSAWHWPVTTKTPHRAG